MNYNFTDYITNSVIKSAVDELVANPQQGVVVEVNQGRTWSLTDGRVLGTEGSCKTSLLQRICNAVVLFFKCWSSSFRANFNNAIQEINRASQDIDVSDEDVSDEELDDDEDLSDQQLWDAVVFGKKEWEQIQGVNDVGDEPKLTADQKSRLIAKLRGVCPIFNQDDNIQPHRFQGSKDNKYWQTHKVILFPEKINGKPVDFDLIGKIFSFEKTVDNKGTVFAWLVGDKNSDFRTKKAPKSYFAIVSKDVIPGSRRTDREIKEGLLKAKGCRVPTPLEALISNVVLNVTPPKAGEDYFFGQQGGSWYTYTATDTKFEGNRLVVGAASASGTEVYADYGVDPYVGVAAVEEVL